MEIPHKEDYEKFLYEFSSGLKYVKGISFFIYGSYMREDFVPGISDLNGFLILNDFFITNKSSLTALSSIRVNALENSNNRIKTKFNVLDKGIAEDGRFLVYSADYVDFLKKNAVKKYGEYNLENMNGDNYDNAEQVSILNNLNDIRKGFFYNEVKSYSNKKDFYESAIKKFVMLPKQLINLSKNELIEKKEESLETFLKEFPEYKEIPVLKTVQSLIIDPVKYESFLESEACFSFSLECLTEMEKMIKVYVEKFPKLVASEVK